MRPLLAAAAVAVCACAKTKEDPARAWLWNVHHFQVKLGLEAGEARELGGFQPEEFLIQGGENPWDTGMLPPAAGSNRDATATPQLNALPGIAAGRNLAFAITEVWQDAPAPWVSPVYIVQQEFEDLPPARVLDLESVFGVRWESTFYTPFWRQQFSRLRPGAITPPKDRVTTVRDILTLENTDGGITDGALVLCPFVPNNTRLADVRPFTGEQLKPPVVAAGRADGQSIFYIGFEPDAFRATPRGVVSRGFLYVFAVGESALLPHVLPNDPQATLLQRVEVQPAGLGVALPPQYGALIDEVRKAGMRVHVMDGGVPLAYAGHVVRTPDCFDTGFPSSCAFLDSEAAIRALPSQRLIETTVLVTAPRIPFADGGAP
jgi:hypothetical protein